jgi:hypothetical protein
MLADQIDGVIGVDTHRDTLTAAAVTPVGGLLGQLAVPADRAGYQRLLDFARAHVAGRRCFAVEGIGSYGAGLTRMLADHGEWVVEVDRPSRPARRGGKTDALDAIRAAREALAQQRPAVPRRRGDRQALRVLLATRQGGGRRADLRHQPAQGAHRGRSRGAARPAARPRHQRPGGRVLALWAASSSTQRTQGEPCLVIWPWRTLRSQVAHLWGQSRPGAQLAGGGKAADVADLGDQGHGGDRSDAGQGLQRGHARVGGGMDPQVALQSDGGGVELVDQGQAVVDDRALRWWQLKASQPPTTGIGPQGSLEADAAVGQDRVDPALGGRPQPSQPCPMT